MLLLLSRYDNETRSKLESLYHTYQKILFIVAYDILKDTYEAQDIVQETIIKVSKHLDKIDGIDSKRTKAYLCMIARNLSINAYHKKKKLYLHSSNTINAQLEIDTLLCEDSYDLALTKEMLHEQLRNINPRYAEIITLRFYYELEISEISDLLNISNNNVSVRISRALTALKELAKKEDLII
ncbi:sigma-70 family RNA polymerase sigma factor [Fusibacter paucivorans]|uniref:Sigma-70 family RNA polymerase sigma factor n=1 Tax=Fusibacter paucivorans TaxID=76009 RepID=A0ABS5PLR3_9FIRM|nr:sigma-70 family RNA polymerase sigma factor [Fusibacter paucivorans]MBS7525291.1 sigma-70 family RNA polymerase sigma factor [Fusibacter paucivorans]